MFFFSFSLVFSYFALLSIYWKVVVWNATTFQSLSIGRLLFRMQQPSNPLGYHMRKKNLYIVFSSATQKILSEGEVWEGYCYGCSRLPLLYHQPLEKHHLRKRLGRITTMDAAIFYSHLEVSSRENKKQFDGRK